MPENFSFRDRIQIDDKGYLVFGKTTISWLLELRRPDGNLLHIRPENMQTHQCRFNSNRLNITWKGCDELGELFEVKTKWAWIDDMLKGKIEWHSACGNALIENVVFPHATVPLYKDSNLLLPCKQGILLNNIKTHVYRTDKPTLLYEAAFQQMQFCACCSKRDSFYFAFEDTNFYLKKFCFSRSENSRKVIFAGIHPLPLDKNLTATGKIPYCIAVRRFSGDWFKSCQIYRQWALRQTWAKCKPSEKIRDIALWIWNRGTACEVIPPVMAIQQAIALPLALDWYWWHQNAYDTSYPEYWPPREGSRKFKKSLQQLRNRGVYTQAYTNGLVWDMESPSWKTCGAKEAVIQRNGQFKSYPFNSFTKNALAWICGGGMSKFREKLKYTAARLADCGIDGMYLDMIGCESSQCCYSSRHNHLPGGGTYQTQGFQKLLREIHQENPTLQLSTEYGSEMYLGFFDSVIDLCPSMERLGMEMPAEFVPAFNAVYHGKTAVFGNYALPDSIPPFDPKWPQTSAWKQEKNWPQLFPEQFFLELARTVIWGYQPTVANLRIKHLHAEEFAELRAFVCNTARFYYQNRQFLFDGKMLPFGKIICRHSTVNFLSRFIFTKPGEEKIISKEIPSILHSVWEAPQGQKALILANYTRQPQSYVFHCNRIEKHGSVDPHSYQTLLLPPEIAEVRKSIRRKQCTTSSMNSN